MKVNFKYLSWLTAQMIFSAPRIFPLRQSVWNQVISKQSLREVAKNGYFTVRLTVGIDPTPPYGQLFVIPQSHHTVLQDDHLQEAGLLFDNHEKGMKKNIFETLSNEIKCV